MISILRKSKPQLNETKLNKKKRFRQFLSNLSGSFFIVIALMPLAGILLGVGSAISEHYKTDSSSAGYVIGNVISESGGFLFNNLGFFFAVAVVIGFTKDWKAAITAIWAYFIFTAIQAGILSGANKYKNGVGLDVFDLWFYRGVTQQVIVNSLGLDSMNTGVVGGLITGWISVVCFNKFKNVELHSFLAFFSGARIVPFIVSIFMFPLAVLAILLWPLVGIGLVSLGNDLTGLPPGVSAGIVAFIWRALTPIGLHHAFYTVFWFTATGGSINGLDYIKVSQQFLQQHPGLVPVDQDWITLNSYLSVIIPNSANRPPTDFQWNGDNRIWFNFEQYGIPFNSSFRLSNGSGGIGGPLNIHPGQYIGPNYPVMIGGSLGSITAMVKTADKKHKKAVFAIMGSALITSMSIGVTEPWLWSYIIIAPILFFGFHSLMTAIGAALLVLTNTHVGAAFSNGLLDWAIYGAVPINLGTNPFIVLLLSAAYIPIYYFVFRYYMIWKKVSFPVIDPAGVALISKEKTRTQSNMDLVVKNLIEGLGGKENIKSLFNCATRVRVDLNDVLKIDEKLLLDSGAFKILKLGNNVQVLYGPKAEIIADNANQYLKSLSK